MAKKRSKGVKADSLNEASHGAVPNPYGMKARTILTAMDVQPTKKRVARLAWELHTANANGYTLGSDLATIVEHCVTGVDALAHAVTAMRDIAKEIR